MGVQLQRKRILTTVLVIGVFATFCLPMPYNPWGPAAFFVPWVQAQRTRERLLCRMDYEVLLKAGREILSQVPKWEPEPERAGQRVLGQLPIPEGTPIPQPIRSLRPRTMLISYDGYLIIEMHGGMDHFGVNIYPENFKEPDPPFAYGDRKLLSGLWYYDEGYFYGGHEYDKKIGALIAKHKKQQKR